MAYFKADNDLTKIFSKYADFADVFLLKLAVRLSKLTGIHDYAVELVDDQQLLYGLIYNLSLMKWETLKLYIKNN